MAHDNLKHQYEQATRHLMDSEIQTGKIKGSQDVIQFMNLWNAGDDAYIKDKLRAYLTLEQVGVNLVM